MRILFLTSLLFIFLIGIFGCDSENQMEVKSKKKELPEVEVPDDFGEKECIVNEKFTPGADGFYDPRIRISIYAFDDSTINEEPCKIENGKFSTTNILEKVVLNNDQKLELEKLIHGMITKRKGNVFEASACYNPRHVIVYELNNKALFFNEICFECRGQRHFDEMEDAMLGGPIDFCDEKWSILKEFFKSVGITYFGPH